MQECSEDTGKCISMILKRFNHDFTKWKQCHQNLDFFLCNYSNCWIAMNNGSLTQCESNKHHQQVQVWELLNECIEEAHKSEQNLEVTCKRNYILLHNILCNYQNKILQSYCTTETISLSAREVKKNHTVSSATNIYY